LDRNVPISTAWGQEMTSSEYRTLREVTTPRHRHGAR
jgi:beta-carotene hydroxylase